MAKNCDKQSMDSAVCAVSVVIVVVVAIK